MERWAVPQDFLVGIRIIIRVMINLSPVALRGLNRRRKGESIGLHARIDNLIEKEERLLSPRSRRQL